MLAFLKNTSPHRFWLVVFGGIWIAIAPIASLSGAEGGSVSLGLIVPLAAIVLGIGAMFGQLWAARGLQVMSWAAAGFFLWVAIGVLFSALNPFAETRPAVAFAIPFALIFGAAQGAPFALMALKLRSLDPTFRVTAIVRIGLVAAALFIVVDRYYGEVRWKDVSLEPEYAGRVGETCVVLKELRAHGVEGDERDITAWVEVTTLPGIGGNEITFTTPLPKGTRFRIMSVRRCTNCLFATDLQYAIEVAEARDLAKYPVFARFDALAPDEVSCARAAAP